MAYVAENSIASLAGHVSYCACSGMRWDFGVSCSTLLSDPERVLVLQCDVDRMLLQAEDGDTDDEDLLDEEEETALESYDTPLDKDNCTVDEYQIFKSVLESKWQMSAYAVGVGIVRSVLHVIAPHTFLLCVCEQSSSSRDGKWVLSTLWLGNNTWRWVNVWPVAAYKQTHRSSLQLCLRPHGTDRLSLRWP